MAQVKDVRMAGNQNKTTVAVIGAVFFAAVMGFAVGRLSVGVPENSGALAKDSSKDDEQGRGPRKNSEVDLNTSRKGSSSRRRSALPSSRWAKAWRNQAQLSEEHGDKLRAKVPLNAALEAARRAENSPDSEEMRAEAREAATGLYFQLSKNPVALAGALRRIPNLTDRGEMGMLAAVLARINDPEVEQMALALTKSSSPLVREGAFDILDGLDSPGARAVALKALAVETEPDIRRAALRAIPDSSGATVDEASETVRQLTEILGRDEDPETRRLAAISLASWHRDLSEFLAVLKALRGDGSATVRGGCAFACEIAGRKEVQIVTVLIQVLQSKDEDSVVRDNAYRALKVMGPLSAGASQVFKDYEKELDARGTGEGSDY